MIRSYSYSYSWLTMRITLSLGLGWLFLTGCAVGPNYSRPSIPAQAGWKEGAAVTNTARLPSDWWRIFNDDHLISLETKAIQTNQDLKRAVARVTEARALVRVSKADLYPGISANGAYSRNRLSASNSSLPQPKLESDNFSSSVDLNYELDVWGRVRRNTEASRADASAVATDLEVVLLTLTSDVARNYYLIPSLHNEKPGIPATIDI